MPSIMKLFTIPGKKGLSFQKITFIYLILQLSCSGVLFAQNTSTFSISVDPTITWFASDRNTVETKGNRPGISYGLIMDHFFGEKYALSTGAGIYFIGGNLAYADTVSIQTRYDTVLIPAGTRLNYRINYVSVPLGLKLKTVEIGYKTFFVDLGIRALFRIKAKASTENNLLQKDDIKEEINFFNMAYFFGGGLEYSLGGNTAITGGLYYARTFLDITSDNIGKQSDYLNANILSLKIGVLF